MSKKLPIGLEIKIKRHSFGAVSYTTHKIVERIKGGQSGNRVNMHGGNMFTGIVRKPTKYKIETGEIFERKKLILT